MSHPGRRVALPFSIALAVAFGGAVAGVAGSGRMTHRPDIATADTGSARVAAAPLAADTGPALVAAAPPAAANTSPALLPAAPPATPDSSAPVSATLAAAPDAAAPFSPTLATVSGGPVALLLADSEFVYGPTGYRFDAEQFISDQNGYLARYSELVEGEAVTGGQIVTRVAEEYAVGPRMLLALIEMHSGWLTRAEPLDRSFAVPEALPGLYPSLSAAADNLNASYYAWRVRGEGTVVLAGGQSVDVAAPNAGTYALLAYLSRDATLDQWATMAAPSRFGNTWASLFGDPYVYQVMPVLPEALPPVDTRLPYAAGEIWFFVAGPHSGWGAGAARASIDLAPPPADVLGCAPSPYPVRATADGTVMWSRASGVAVDLDDDGYAGTGWVHIYAHLSAIERAAAGTVVAAGDLLGYASCDGGPPSMARVAFGRRYNGEWVPADRPEAPMVLDGWRAMPGEAPGTGWLIREGVPPRAAAPTKNLPANGIAAPVVGDS